jgi:hypothetical protein
LIIATALDVADLVRLAQPNGAGVPRVLATGGGDIYNLGTSRKAIEVPGTGVLGVKIHPAMSHELQSKGYVKLPRESMVGRITVDNNNELPTLTLDYLQYNIEQA